MYKKVFIPLEGINEEILFFGRDLKLLPKLLTGFIFSVFFLLSIKLEASNLRRRDIIVKIVEKVSPAVVNIRAEEVYTQKVNPFFSMDPFFDEFFHSFFDDMALKRKIRTQSLGTGVVIDSKGLILTNEHVIKRASDISISLKDGREFKVDVVAAEPDFDIAVLKASKKVKLPSAKMGTSSNLMPGETVVAIGNPFGFSHTVTVGVVSALNRSIKTKNRQFYGFIQTDASINPGNSGGPLLNIEGRVIGINTTILGGGQGISFAIPIDKAKRVVAELLQYGEVRPGWIGVIPVEIKDKLKRSLVFGKKSGVPVAGVEKGSPAARAGIERGDVVFKFNEELVKNVMDFLQIARKVVPGEKVRLEVWKREKLKNFKFSAREFPEKKALELARILIGIEVREKKGKVVIVKVIKGSIAKDIGFRRGDIIRRIGKLKIKSLSNFRSAIITYRYSEKLLLLVEREGVGYYVTIPLFR